MTTEDCRTFTQKPLWKFVWEKPTTYTDAQVTTGDCRTFTQKSLWKFVWEESGLKRTRERNDRDTAVVLTKLTIERAIKAYGISKLKHGVTSVSYVANARMKVIDQLTTQQYRQEVRLQ